MAKLQDFTVGRMGRAGFEKKQLRESKQGNVHPDGAFSSGHWRRERPNRRQAPPPTLPRVDVHGVLFAVVFVVFVIYPLAQWALGR